MPGVRRHLRADTRDGRVALGRPEAAPDLMAGAGRSVGPVAVRLPRILGRDHSVVARVRDDRAAVVNENLVAVAE